MRHWINLCEGFAVPNIDYNQVEKYLINSIDWSGGTGESIVEEVARSDSDIPVDEDGIPDTNSKEYEEALSRWAHNRISDAEDNIEHRFEGNKIKIWRVIMAPEDWTPDENTHPGIYWSWDERAADAHWGDFKNGNVKWILAATVTADQIDWIPTLAANAEPSYEDEREIRLLPNTSLQYSYRRK